MSLLFQSFTDFKGLQPSIGHLQSADIAVLRGRNFRWRLKGPYSGWGNRLVTKPFGNSLPYYATFSIDNTAYQATPYGMLQYDCENCEWVNVCPAEPTCWDKCTYNDYPWSKAFVGDTHYFSHPTVGLIAYNAHYCTWEKCEFTCKVTDKGEFIKMPEGCGELIAGPFLGITQANNRLILLAKDTVSWSAPDDGKDFSCSIDCGSGFQSLSVGEYGQPLAVHQTASGFLLYTTKSLVHFEELGDLATFRVSKVVSRSKVPINPHAIVATDRYEHYFVAKNGVYTTDGGYPKAVIPEVSDFIREAIVNYALLKNQHSIKLFYLGETEELFISFIAHPDEVQNNNLYTRSLVYNETVNKLSSLDQPHYFIGPVNHSESLLNTEANGMIGADRAWRIFDHSRFNTGMNNEALPLNSFIELGPFSPQSEQAPFLETELQKVKLHTGPMISGINNRIAAATISTDNWEENSTVWSVYNAVASSTRDGYSTSNSEAKQLHPVTVDFYAQNFDCNTYGQYHTIRIDAENGSQYYELNRVDCQFYRAGYSN